MADALGLALFALSGAEMARGAGHSLLIVLMMGTMTGVTGGILRDVITARIPLILQKEIYATAAMSGILVYLLLIAVDCPDTLAFSLGVGVVVVLRVLAIHWGLHLPGLRRPSTD